MTTVAIAYHSGYGHTKKQAEAVAAGARDAGADVSLIAVDQITDADWATLDAADAIIFGSPVYMGSISAEFKKFMEESSKLWFTQAWKDKLAAGFVNSASFNGDKQTAIIQLATFAAQHGMLWVSLGLLPANSSKSERNDLNRMGSSLGAFAQSDSDLGAEVVPPLGDLATARYLGQRVAELTLRQK
mgnify:CR=1 FL=1